jgi:peptide deformylase
MAALAIRRWPDPVLSQVCAQHEYDHLNGIVTLDRLAPHARAKAETEYGV